MSEVQQIVKQLQHTFKGPAWHGPSVEEALGGVTAATASAPSPGGAHNIWQIALHTVVWKNAVGRWLTGDRARPGPNEDWPPIADASEAAWQKTLQAMRQAHELLSKTVAELPEARLDERLFDDMPSVRTTLYGIIQHDLYHAGQIALLKKMHG